ncbi:GIY-YIG nuclease family protein [Mucilaginibacter gossypii]|uniref:GIY-YIG nuclease family protein n=1 Tax=Mucilaginibacter gossypii TaxID=551996 RepID=UPI000DCAE5A1|nr:MULTISPECIES: GIY-YIG nuclease family protein [Mucilaginibacter]QTE35916.1 GIY-YIG nuclease family protein [Mucilaginibacter gossypii]RAV54721.1 GIY-YIG nuclease family protein [Mucilaginibacter rubeus]
MEIKALTITQYLIQGDPDGLVASYISNWTGQCLKFPRNLLGAARSRDEFKRPGVYFLIGQDPTEVNKWIVYVGESEGLDIRLTEHDRDLKKDFWEQAIVFSSKDENLTKGHVRYLEFRLQEELKKQARVGLENINVTKPKLPEASMAEMETYLDFLKLLLPVLGFPFFEKLKPGDLGVREQLLFLNINNQKAQGYLTPKGIVVKKLSTISPVQSPAISGNYGLLRQSLNDQGIVSFSSGKFLVDYEFSSPSAAAAVILGYNINGRDAWKTKEGVTINQLEQNR